MAKRILAAPRTIPADLQHDIICLAVLRNHSQRQIAALEYWRRKRNRVAVAILRNHSCREAYERKREEVAGKLARMVKAVRA